MDVADGIDAMLAKKDFRQTSWASLSENLAILDAHLETNPDKNLAVVDAPILRADPDGVMEAICEKIEGLTYSSTMPRDWTKATGKNFYHPNAPKYDEVDKDGVTKSIWIGDTIRSTEFWPPNDTTLPTHQFPEGMQQHIL